jgi:phosphatidylserine decarboxylase
MFDWTIPESIRPSVFKTFSWIFSANLSEIEKPLNEYKSLNDFFTRKLKENARKIDEHLLVSPCDGRVATLGIVSDTLDCIKGRSYDFSLFLTGLPKENFQDYRSSLKQSPENELFYITLYLAPGDYHRFHSSADWEITYRRHLYGYLLGVFKQNLWRRSDVFTVNERVAYFGKWKFGAFHYVAVAAFNVGDISVGCDPSLKTNKSTFDGPYDTFDQKTLSCCVPKGSEFGVFHAGSTIVLIFEAPKNFTFAVKPGDRVQVGNKLADLIS